MKNQSKRYWNGAALGLIALISSSFATAGSVSIPNNFSAGEAATAASVNQNFTAVKSAVDDNDRRISTLETSPTVAAQDFTGYAMPFAAIGSAKNVVVLKTNTNLANGQFAYYVRSRYANDTETVSVNGVPTIRPYIANYAFVALDANENILQINNSIEAPLTADYLDLVLENSFYDLVSLTKTVNDDLSRQSFDCAGAGSNIQSCTVTTTSNADGSIIGARADTRVYTLGGSKTFNGLTFNEVRFEHRIRASVGTDLSGEIRIRAKGMGEVKRVFGGVIREVVYYRVNGQTGGSLAGTPFAPGALLDGLFF